MEYLKEWTLVNYYDFRGSLRGQGKRRGGMVLGAMFDRSSARLIKSEIKWGNYPYFSDDDRKFFLRCSGLAKVEFDKVMMKTGNLKKAIEAMYNCEAKILGVTK